MKRLQLPQLSLLLVCLFTGVIQLWACTIPVFRYALDRWRPDPYGVHISEAWLETEAGKQFAEQAQELSELFQIVPGEEKEGEIALLQPAPGSPEVWRGKPDLEALRGMLNSPARKKIAAEILAGNSVVFAMVLTGDKKADGELEAKLTKRLGYLGQVMAIPPQDPFDPENKLGPGPELKVGFTTVKIQRDDPQEQLLIKMLAGQNGDELIKSEQPFAAPVFGRGRALGAWKSEDLDDEGIDELCQFLLGACSCQVKAQNPGWDILIGTDWDEGLMKVAMAREREADETTASAPDDDHAPEPEKKTEPLEPEVVTFGAKEESKPAPTAPQVETGGSPKPFILIVGLILLLGGFLAWRSSA